MEKPRSRWRAWAAMLAAGWLAGASPGQTRPPADGPDLIEQGRELVTEFLAASTARELEEAASRFEALGPSAALEFSRLAPAPRAPADRPGELVAETYRAETVEGLAILDFPSEEAPPAPEAGRPLLVVFPPRQLHVHAAYDTVSELLGPFLADAGYLVAVARPLLLQGPPMGHPARPNHVRWTQGSADLLPYLIGHLTRSYAVDPDRVSLMGLEDGADGALRAGELFPDRLAALILLDGRLAGKGVTWLLPNVRPVPILLGYGALGRPPNTGSQRNLQRALAAVGCELEVRAWTGREDEKSAGGSSPAMAPRTGAPLFHPRELVEFLSGRKRSRIHRVVRMRVGPTGPSALDWLEVQTDGSSSYVEVDARPEENSFHIQPTRGVEALTLYLPEDLHNPDRDLRIWYGEELVYRGRPAPDPRGCLEQWRRGHDLSRIFPYRVQLELARPGRR